MRTGRSAQPWARRLAAGVFAVNLGGCVASIKEDRLYGPPRPSIESAPGVVTEREAPTVVIRASRRGESLDLSVERASACRDVDISPRVRDVTVRRSFVGDSQELNLAFALLFGAGAGVLQFGAEQIDCPSGSACWSAMIAGQYTMLALAAIPIGFAAYNALRVRDGSAIEPVPPELHPGPWRTCSREPMAGEPLEVTVGTHELTRVTDEDGHAVVDLSALPPAPDGTPPRRAVVRRPGSADVIVDWAPTPPDSPVSPAPLP